MPPEEWKTSSSFYNLHNQQYDNQFNFIAEAPEDVEYRLENESSSFMFFKHINAL
jgi:hypothetical protein